MVRMMPVLNRMLRYDLVGGHQYAVCTIWNGRAPGSVIGSAC